MYEDGREPDIHIPRCNPDVSLPTLKQTPNNAPKILPHTHPMHTDTVAVCAMAVHGCAFTARLLTYTYTLHVIK